MHWSKRVVILVGILSLVTSGLFAATPIVTGKAAPTIIRDIKHDVSPPLRELAKTPAAARESDQNENPFLPKAKPSSSGIDQALQSVFGPNVIPPTIANFEGVNNIDGVYPPDTNGDVGGNFYMQWVNLHLQVFNKSTGASLLGPLAGNAIWAGFGGVCQSLNNGDPIVLYDHLADRWMISQFALATSNFHQCIAISQTNDPTGSWYRYDFLYSTSNMNDYPHFGVWPDGYYMSVNQFLNGSSWAGAGAAVFERDKMLLGQGAQVIIFNVGATNLNYGGMLPSHLNGPPPPVGSPNYFWEFDDSTWIAPADALRVWKFHVDWANPPASTFGLANEPNFVIPTAAFNPSPCVGVTRNCIPQPGTTVKLDVIGDRLMYRVQYRNYGDHESVVMNHTVDAGGGRHGVRWYELRDLSAPGGPTIFQQGTYAPADTEHRWMASLAMDISGDIGLGFSVSSSAVFPSIRYTGRLAGDALGTMGQGEGSIIAGSGYQTGSASRWGDYSAMSVDPTDGCTFYYTNEYLVTNGPAPWQTRVGSFKFPTCTAGPSGTLQGTVTDASTTNPIAGAMVSTGSFSTLTDAAGFYQFANLAVGTYNLTASKYGYQDQVVNNVSVTDGGTTVQNFALTPATTVTLDGTVTDGSGGGYPLYAKVTVTGNGFPGGPVYTDPVTGHYSVILMPAAATYNIKVEAVYPGYDFQTRDVVIAANSTQNFALLVSAACTAAGYYTPGVIINETFTAPSLPAGWSVVTAVGPGWKFNNPCSRANLTGGTGGFAIADSDCAGSGSTFDSSLITPTLNMTGFTGATLSFKSDFNRLGDTADVDLSIDGGTVWTNIYRRTVSERGPRTITIPLPTANNQANVKIRWRLYNSAWAWWWEVDDVKVYDATIGVCTAIPGGYVLGNVYNGISGVPIDGAAITDGTSNTVSAPTPNDPALDDGFYWLWSATGLHTYTASKAMYGSDSHDVTVAASSATRQDFQLGSALLVASPASFTVRLNTGQTLDQTLGIENQGTSNGSYQIQELNLPLVLAPFHGTINRAPLLVAEKLQNELDARSFTHSPAPGAVQYPNAGEVIASWPTGLTLPWGAGFNTNADDLWVSNPVAGGGDDLDHRYLRNGTNTGDTIDTAPYTAGGWFADMAYDPFANKLWQVHVSGDNCVYELDPVSMTFTGNKVCPAFGTSERGLAYDPVTDSFWAGSWNNSVLVHFDRSGNILDSKNVGLAISGLAYNPTTHHLFVIQNAAAGWDVYVLDASSPSYNLLGAFDVAGMTSNSQAGMEMSCDGHLWLVNQSAKTVLEVNSGETGACNMFNIPWVSENPTSGTVAAGATDNVTLTFDTAGQPFGLQRAQLKIANDTPTPTDPVALNFTKAFSDVSAASPFDRFIHGMAGAGVTQGCGGTNFCPTANTTRGIMAAWLLKSKFGSTYTPPAPTGQIFNDVSTETANAAFIEDLYSRGITAGCSANPPLYCPDNSITRQQMAVFLLVTKEGTGYVPPPAVGIFSDVPVSSPFAKWVEELYNRGITAGCGVNPLRYCPTNPITRQQMAVFVVTTFGIPHL